MESTTTYTLASEGRMRCYGAYGHEQSHPNKASTAYAGEVMESGSGCSLLGGRLYSPVLRRFLNADPVSPFDAGGVNRYAYCSGDPINRIDPSGNAWWDWVGLALGAIGAAAAVVATGGALLGMVAAAAAGSLAASVSTPAIVQLVAVSVLEVVSVAAEIGSVASTASGNETTGGILGWVAFGTGIASAGRTMVTKSTMRASQAAKSAPTIRRASDVGENMRGQYSGFNIPRNRFVKSSRTGDLRVRNEWVRFKNPSDPNIHVYGADAMINIGDLKRLLTEVGRQPFEHGYENVYVHGGGHGAVYADDLWQDGVRTGGLQATFYNAVANRSTFDALLPGRKLIPSNISGRTMEEIEDILDFRGTHILASCYSAADDLVLPFTPVEALAPLYIGRPPWWRRITGII